MDLRSALSPRLVIEGLEVRFGPRRVLDGLELEISAGERIGLVGENGAGKSTLLGAIAGTTIPSSGRIRLDGQDLGRRGPTARARLGIARAFQGDALAASLEVEAHLAVAGPDAARWAERLELDPWARTPAHAAGRAVRRRLALALALARRPKVLLLDEPFAGLADGSRAPMLAALDAARAEGTAVLWIEHEQAFLSERTDRVLELRGGRLLPKTERDAWCAADRDNAGHPGVVEQKRDDRPSSSSLRGLCLELRVPLDGGAELSLGPLRLAPGEAVALSEAAGAGAESLLGLRPSEGRLEMDGQPVSARADARRRAGIAGVLDPPRLVAGLSIDAHLRLARSERGARTILQRLLPDARARGRVPAGLASGGERRILGLALAASDAPRLLVLETITAGLAPSVVRELDELLAELRAKGTMVIFAGRAPPTLGETNRRQA